MPSTDRHDHVAVTVCVCVCLLGYLHVPLVRRSATAATATIAAGRQILPGNGEQREVEGSIVDPQVLTLAPKCFRIKYIYKSDKIATSNSKNKQQIMPNASPRRTYQLAGSAEFHTA